MIMAPESQNSSRRKWFSQERPPRGQLGPAPWLSWPETQTIIAALSAQGTSVRFVGGCVRDGILGVMPRDIDIGTPDPPETVIELLQDANVRWAPTGVAHGTVTAWCGNHRFEITTLREDVTTDGRHAQVRWSSEWMADAARRDFTINALSATPDGAVYDYFHGLDDLAHGRVFFVGRAMDRIPEDWLRILRFFRFYARYGHVGPSSDAMSACQKYAPHLQQISKERVRDELIQIFEHSACVETLLLMRGVRVLEQVLPEAQAFGVLRQVIFLETRGLVMEGIVPDPWRRLAAVLQADVSTTQNIAQRLKLSNAQCKYLVARAREQFSFNWDDEVALPSLNAALHRCGRACLVDHILIAWAMERDGTHRVCQERNGQWRVWLEYSLSAPVPIFPLSGQDLLQRGYLSGPPVGKELARLQALWLEAGCSWDNARLLAEMHDPPENPPSAI